MRYFFLNFEFINWFKTSRNYLLLTPNRLLAFKAGIVVGFIMILMLYLDKPLYAVTMGLGAISGALSETDEHPNGRFKSMSLKVLAFAISSFSVNLLLPYPSIFLGLGLSLSTIVFILIGGISERFRGVTFGALLIGIFAMIGANPNQAWHIQPLLLTSGAFIYGVVSYLFLLIKPYSLLEVQLAKGFSALSLYYHEKSKLFSIDENNIVEITAKLALLNVQTVKALDECKEVLNSYSESLSDQRLLTPYFHYFIVLQSLHERAASSHESYHLLVSNPSGIELIGGIRQLLNELSRATLRFSKCLITSTTYKHPSALDWLENTIKNLSIKNQLKATDPLNLLIINICQSNQSLKNSTFNNEYNLLPKLEKDTRTYFERFKSLLHYNHPRMRFALRLSIAFFIGFSVLKFFNIQKGEWIILTILFVLQPSYSDTRRRMLQRVLGTFLGVISAMILIKLSTFYGQIILMTIAAYYYIFWNKSRYSIAVLYITIYILCAFHIIAYEGYDVVLPRLLDTSIGALISILVVRFIWPDWQYKKLPFLLKDSMDKNTSYFKAILNEYKKGTADDLTYRITRREAHRADNALVLAWQNMQLEPKKHQKLLDSAFTLTYLNHALLSYLSALGAHRNQQNSDITNLFFFENHILNILDKSCNWLSLQTIRDYETIDESLEEITKLLAETNSEKSKMENILLFNIAEITLQIVDHAKRFKHTANSN